MTPDVRLLRPDDPDWSRALHRVTHDVHHTPGWARATAPLEGGAPAAVLVEDHGRDVALLAPLVRRELDGGRWDAVSPYGYPGPALTPGVRGPEALALLDVAAAALAEGGAVTWFLRLHPLLDDWLAEHPAARSHGQVVSVDLAGDDEDFERALRRDHRSDLRRARRDGLEATVRVAAEAGTASFATLYDRSMARLGAASYHRFPPEHFAALASALGDRLVLVEVRAEADVAAAALFTLAPSAGVCGYHLAASVPAPPRGATKLVIDAGRRLGRAHGCTRLLLGGGLGSAEDPLFAFKAGFSPDRHRFRTLRLVLDPEAYAARCAAAGVEATLDGYFPAYRTPPG